MALRGKVLDLLRILNLFHSNCCLFFTIQQQCSGPKLNINALEKELVGKPADFLDERVDSLFTRRCQLIFERYCSQLSQSEHAIMKSF